MDSISNSRERKLQWPWNSIDLKLLNFKTALNSEQERHLINVLGLVFYKQPVYKQIALEWQIAKQLSRLNAFSLSNNKNYRLKKSGVFSL